MVLTSSSTITVDLVDVKDGELVDTTVSLSDSPLPLSMGTSLSLEVLLSVTSCLK